MKRKLATVILVLGAVVLLAQAVSAQGIVIGPSVRNGSFEDGILSPWFGNGIGVQSDSLFATHGSWYAVFGDAVFLSAHREVRANPGDGVMFLHTFDARTGIPNPNTVSVQLNRRAGGLPLMAVVIPIVSPRLSPMEWRSYKCQLQFSGGGWTQPLGLSIAFTGSTSEPRIAYLDNVVLQESREPSSLALLYSGGLLLAGLIGWKRLA